MHKLPLNKAHVNYKSIIKLKLWVLINLPSILYIHDYICMYVCNLHDADEIGFYDTYKHFFCTVAAVDLTVSQ